MPNARLQVFKCSVCSNMVEMLHPSTGTLVCCSQPMNLLTENTTDAAKEKHVPVIERSADGLKVKVGAIPHPMEEKHYIEWIEVSAADGRVVRQFLKPGQAPAADFCARDRVVAREFCNLHGLWKAEG